MGGGGGGLSDWGGPTLSQGRLSYHFVPPIRWRWCFVSTLFQTAWSQLVGWELVEWWTHQNKMCSSFTPKTYATNFGWICGNFYHSTKTYSLKALAYTYYLPSTTVKWQVSIGGGWRWRWTFKLRWAYFEPRKPLIPFCSTNSVEVVFCVNLVPNCLISTSWWRWWNGGPIKIKCVHHLPPKTLPPILGGLVEIFIIPPKLFHWRP